MANSSRSETYYCDAALLLALVYTVATIRSDLRYIFVQIPSRDNLLKKALFNICIMRLIIFFFSEKILRELNMMNYITVFVESIVGRFHDTHYFSRNLFFSKISLYNRKATYIDDNMIKRFTFFEIYTCIIWYFLKI